MRAIDRDLDRMLAQYAAAMGKPMRGFKYRTLYELQLKEGVRFSEEPYTEEEEELLRDAFRYSSKQKWKTQQCFHNAQNLMLFDDRFDYAEGFVLMPDLPVVFDHGWVALGDKPVDITLRESGAPDTCNPDKLLARAAENLKNAYRGVLVDREEVQKHRVRTGMSEAMTHVSEIMREILRKGFAGFGR